MSVHKWRLFRVLLRLASGDTTLCDCSSACTLSWALLAANMSGIRPILSGLLGLTSSRQSSISTASSNPHSAAYERGVLPSLSGLSGMISSCPYSILITLIYASVSDEYLRLEAYERGVRPRLSGLSGLTSPGPRSISTTPTNPRSAVYERDALPSLSGSSGMTSSRPYSIFITLIYASVSCGRPPLEA